MGYTLSQIFSKMAKKQYPKKDKDPCRGCGLRKSGYDICPERWEQVHGLGMPPGCGIPVGVLWVYSEDEADDTDRERAVQGVCGQ